MLAALKRIFLNATTLSTVQMRANGKNAPNVPVTETVQIKLYKAGTLGGGHWIKTEENAKIVCVAWGTCLNAALAI